MTAPPSPPPAKPAFHARRRTRRGGRCRSTWFRTLVRASGGPRYTVALAVDAAGTGLLRPFLLLYGIRVLRLPPLTAGLAITAGVIAGLACTPVVGRWLDRGTRSTAVAAAMLVRVIGTALLLATPANSMASTWLFAGAALFLGTGNQAFPVAHAALIASISQGRERDAALATCRSVRNAGLGLGALLATAALTGGTPALRALAGVTGLSYLLSAALPGPSASGPTPSMPLDSPATLGDPATLGNRPRRGPADAPAARRECQLRVLPERSGGRTAACACDATARVAGVGGGRLRGEHGARGRVPGPGDGLDVPVLAPHRAGHLRGRDQRLVPGFPGRR